MAVRVSQSTLEMVTQPTANVRVSQAVVELVVDGPQVAVSCNNPPPGQVNVPYTQQFTASLGTPPYTFAVTVGSLPSGLSMNSAGLVTGTPTTAGAFVFTITATDSSTPPRTSSIQCSITIVANQPIVLGRTGGVSIPAKCSKRNPYDWCLFDEEFAMRMLSFPPMCNIPEEYRNQPVWGEDYFGSLPPQAKTFRPAASIVTPATAAGDQTVLSLPMPRGYDGILTGIYQFYSGTGFVNGSGDIIWRIQINQRYAKDMGNNPFALGSPVLPFPMLEGLLLLSGQTARYIVNVPNLSGQIQIGASRIVCAFLGFYWPRG